MKKRVVSNNIIFSILFIVVGAIILYASSDIKLIESIEGNTIINSRFYPRIIGSGIIILALLLLLQSIKPSDNDAGVVVEESVKTDNFLATKKTIIAVIFCILYVAAFLKIGVIVSTLIYLFAMLLLFGINKESKAKFILVPIITTVLIYFLFSKLLEVSFPRGILF